MRGELTSIEASPRHRSLTSIFDSKSVPAFHRDTRDKPRVAVSASVLTTTVRIDACNEKGYQGCVFRDDRLGIIGEPFGFESNQRLILLRITMVTILVGLDRNRQETVRWIEVSTASLHNLHYRHIHETCSACRPLSRNDSFLETTASINSIFATDPNCWIAREIVLRWEGRSKARVLMDGTSYLRSIVAPHPAVR